MTDDVMPPTPDTRLALEAAMSNAVEREHQHLNFYYVSADQGRIFRKSLEAMTAATALFIGVFLIMAGYGPYVGVLSSLATAIPAKVWGVFVFALAIVRICVLIVNGWWIHSYLARKWISCSFLFMVWLPIVGCLMRSIIFENDRFLPFIVLAFSIFVAGVELLIFYAHSAFVYVRQKEKRDVS